MQTDVILIAAGVLVLSAALTGGVLRFAARHGLLDLPNERSSHSAPTPRGGGIAIVLASLAGVIVLRLLGAVESALVLAVLVGGGAVAMVGFIDDRTPLSAAVRLPVHAGAALWALIVLGGLPAMQIGEHVVRLGWSGYVVGALAIMWTLNLFNFMDGIDGIAAAEAIYVMGAGALLFHVSAAGVSASYCAIVFAMACLGFLVWNWAPARIFMGDVGSGYLGYVIAVVAIASAHDSPTALMSWLILGGVFFCDATVTLIRRLIRRDRVHEAHRTHAYQWLGRRWHSHSRVTIALTAINVCWLLPWALFASRHAPDAGWAATVALAPVVLLVFFTGAGRAET